MYSNRGTDTTTTTHKPLQDCSTVFTVSHILDAIDNKNPEVIRGDRGDILLCNFWHYCTDVVVDVHMKDCNVPSYDRVAYVKCLAKHKQAKKKKNLHMCLAKWMHFTLLVFSVDGMMGQETEAFMKRLRKHLAIKSDSPFPRIIDYLLSRLSISNAWATQKTLQHERHALTI